jgi:homopolymeric O-antigen transport system permease protein
VARVAETVPSPDVAVAEPGPAPRPTGARGRQPLTKRRRRHVYAPPRPGVPRLGDLWRSRGLVRDFGKVFVQKRYRRTFLGWLWIPLRPASDVAGRVFLFGGLLGVSSGDRPYFMFFVVGSLAWQFFSRGVVWATRALDLHNGFLSRIAVPRATAVVAALVLAAIESSVYIGFLIIGAVYFKLTEGSFYVSVNEATSMAVVGMLLLALYVIAIGFWTSPLAARARDVRFVLVYVLGLVYMCTPVIYPISSIPESFRPIAELNPITAPVELVKWGLLGTAPPSSTSLTISLVVLVVVITGGLVSFSRAEARAAQEI